MTEVDHEPRMLIDGKLVESDSGQTFDNVNPATEEVLGPVADASAAEMHRAIDAATAGLRRDATGPPTASFASECLSQLQEALEKRAGGATRGADPRGRVPADDHARQPARHPARRRAALPDQADRRVRVGTEMPDGPSTAGARPTHARSGRSRSAWSAPSCRGTSRSRSRSTSSARRWPPATRWSSSRRRTRPWNATRLGRLVAEQHRLPAGRSQRRHLLRPPGRRGADALARRST